MNRTKVIGLIDDEPSKLLELEDSLLDRNEYQAFISKNPDDALEWVETGAITLLASDYNLYPNINGIQLLGKVRSINQRIPLVLFTYGAIHASDVRKCKELNIKFLDKKEGNENLTNNLVDEVETNGYEIFSSLAAGKNIATLEVKPKQSNEIVDYLKAELVQSLRKIRNQEGQIVLPGNESISIKDLINRIDEGYDEVGQKYLELWVKTKLRLSKIGNH